MDIQVLNEIANQVRQTSLSQVKASIAANAHLKALKGSAVPVPGDPSVPPLEDSPDQIQAPVAPDISPVARAASTYSSVVGGELNCDELQAIQDLAGRVQTVVSEFLSQPGLEQAENAAAAVASNPEAVQELTSSVEQAVLATLDLPTMEGEVIVSAVPPPATKDLPANIPALESPISIERITKRAELNNPVVAANPAVVDSRASETTGVENPVTVEEVPETPRGDFRVTAPSPASPNVQAGQKTQVETSEVVARPESQNAFAQNTEVENPVALPVSPVDQGRGLEKAPVETVQSKEVTAPPAEAGSQAAPSPSNPQPASTPPQSGLSSSNDLFAQESATVNPENIRDVNELVGSVVSSEFTAEAKKIFSEPKVIRTVADLADFILERLQEIIAIKQQQPQSSGETGIS